MKKQLGVNIDHVATVRQARLGTEPEPLLAALEAQRGGADSITVHLREDRRHIQDGDVRKILRCIRVPLNLEMSLAPGIVDFAVRLQPKKVCLVPERRQELTTEGGLDVLASYTRLAKAIPRLRRIGAEVSLFVPPQERQILAASRLGAQAVEIHTGAYANAHGPKQKAEWAKIRKAAQAAWTLKLKVNAGHGLNYENVEAVAMLPEIAELNIGHSIISRSIFVGLRQAVQEMKKILQKYG
ncbi:MAG: pyridoxine 5'-phosphate synthase [Candidatus Omnitrophota bacterium]